MGGACLALFTVRANEALLITRPEPFHLFLQTLDPQIFYTFQNHLLAHSCLAFTRNLIPDKMDGLSGFLSALPGDRATQESSPSRQSTVQDPSRARAAEDIAVKPLPRLLDSDPSKFRSLKRVIAIGHPGSGIDGECLKPYCSYSSLTSVAGIGDALKKLGFKVYDFQAASNRYERDFPLWLEAARLREEGRPYNKSDYDKVIGDHDAIVGVPACSFDEDLVRLYSNVKVILLTRDSDQAVIQELWEKVSSPFWQRIDPAYFAALGHFLTLYAKAYDIHHDSNQAIRDIVRGKNMLEIRNLIAWVPLCQFLGVRVPDEPAPELHDKTIKGEIAARPQRMISESLKKTSRCIFNNLKQILTLIFISLVSALAVFLGVVGLPRLSSYGVQLISFLLLCSQVRDVTCLLAVGAASCTFVCGFVAGYCLGLTHKAGAVMESPRPDFSHKSRFNRKKTHHDRGRQFDNIENVRPERPVLQEWCGVQENIRRDDAGMRKEGQASLEEWKNGKHVTFHVKHKRTEAGQDLFSGPRKIVSVTEETVR